MMKAWRVIIGFVLLWAAPSPVAAQQFPALQIKLENYLRAAAYEGDAAPIIVPYPPESFAAPGTAAADGGTLITYHARFLGLEPYELTRFDTALEGAGRGMTLGLLAGAIGTTTGMFGEDTAWYVAGGMAALGALFGGTYGAPDPAHRIRYRWMPPPELEGTDALHQPDN